MGGDACVMGSWPSAGAAAPRVKPPANVAPLFRSSRRLKRFEPIGSPSQMSLRGNRFPEVESIRPTMLRREFRDVQPPQTIFAGGSDRAGGIAETTCKTDSALAVLQLVPPFTLHA